MFKRLMSTALVFGMAATGPPVLGDGQSAAAQSRRHQLIEAPLTTVQLGRPRVACAPRAEITAILKRRHGEALLGFGLRGMVAAYEVWRSSKSGSWTIVLTRPNNISCIMAAGQNWMEVNPPPAIAQAAVSPR